MKDVIERLFGRGKPIEAASNDCIAIVRHGEYDGKKLNVVGQSQMQKMGERLNGFLNQGERSRILSSTAPRALESAAILAEILNVSVEEHNLFWPGRYGMDLPAAYKLVQSIRGKANLAVVVTHFEYTAELPGYLAKLDLGLDIPPSAVDNGRGRLLDYKSRRVIEL